MQISLGNLARSVMFGFTQPYMFDRPLQFGFTVFGNKISYNQARQLSIFSGQNLNLPNAVLQNLQNYSQSSVGFHHVAELSACAVRSSVWALLIRSTGRPCCR